MTQILDLKVFSTEADIKQASPGGNMCVASQESSLEENSVWVHEVLYVNKQIERIIFISPFFFSFMNTGDR